MATKNVQVDFGDRKVGIDVLAAALVEHDYTYSLLGNDIVAFQKRDDLDAIGLDKALRVLDDACLGCRRQALADRSTVAAGLRSIVPRLPRAQ